MANRYGTPDKSDLARAHAARQAAETAAKASRAQSVRAQLAKLKPYTKH